MWKAETRRTYDRKGLRLDIEIVYRRPWEGNEEQVVVMLRTVPSFEAFGRLLEVSNPLLVWTRMMEAAWSPWARCSGSIRALTAEPIPNGTGSALHDDRGTERDHPRHPRHAPRGPLLSDARV
jgi:hypothetical protein